MKKILALLLLISLLPSALLTSCGHKHNILTDWAMDATHHWHPCERDGCKEMADKAEHTWDAGEITQPATAAVPGVRTYTCTVCGGKKAESIIVRATVTDEEWAAALALSNFTVSATLVERTWEGTLLMKVTDSAMYRKTEDHEFYSVKKNDGWHVVEKDGLSAVTKGASASVSYVLKDFAVPADANFIYDDATKSYTYETAETTKTEGNTTITTYSDKYLFYFEDGKLVKFEFCEGGYTSVTTIPDSDPEIFDDTRAANEVSHRFIFSDYGTTIVNIPKA